MATEIKSIECIVLNLLNTLEEGKMTDVKRQLIKIAASGGISEEDTHSIDDILSYLDRLVVSVSELKLLCTKTKKVMDDL